MLVRRTIRTKLIIGMLLMLAVVALLAASALWGLSRYRGLADAVSLQADEIALTHQLSQTAESIRDIGHRIRQLQNDKYLPADTPLLLRRMQNESDLFEFSLSEFDRLLDSYRRRAEMLRPEDDLFLDPTQRMASVEAIADQLEKVREVYAQPIVWRNDPTLLRLHRELDTLAVQAETLTGLMHEGMAAYSSDVHRKSRSWVAVAWSCMIASVGMFVILCVLFHSLVVKPFRTLLGGSRLVAAGQFDHRIDLGTGDELSELADVVNQMTQRFQSTCVTLENERADLDRQVRDRTREVVQREQLASVGFLAAGVAHEINNPLASIAWSAEALESRMQDVIHGQGQQRQVAAEEATVLGENLRRIQDEAYRCKGITERLLDFSRLGSVKRTTVDICELVDDVVAMVGTLGQYRCKTLRADCPGQITAWVNGQQMRQVVLNLITNALESVDTDGAVDVQVRSDGGAVHVVVADNGCGMTDEVLENLFEPFFTRRRDGKGTGLGLSITHRIVTQHGGSLNAHSDGPGQGSRLLLVLPAGAEDAPNPLPLVEPATAAHQGVLGHESIKVA